MSQPSGIALNNSHLLRAALAFAVLGVIGPGLLQLQPPQWLGAPDAPVVEVATRLSEIADNEVGSDSAAVAEPASSEFAAAPDLTAPGIATPAQPAPRTGQPESVVQGPSRDSVTAGEGAKPTAETEIAKAQADEPAPAKAAPVAPDMDQERQLRCFNSKYGKLDVSIIGRRAEIRMPGPLVGKRSRVNCTMPGPEGRWRWFGRQFLTE